MNKELHEFLDAHAAQNAYLYAQLRDFYTQNSAPVLGAIALPVGSTDQALTVLSNAPGRLLGWSLRETSGTDAATVKLLDGTNDDGRLLCPIEFTAGQSVRDWFGPAGISFGAGVFVDITTGAVEGTVFLGRVDA